MYDMMNNGWLGDHVHNHRIGFSYLYFVISSWWHAFLFLSTDSELVIHLLWLLTSELLYDQALSVANTVGSVAYEERQTHEWMDWWIRSCGWLCFYSFFLWLLLLTSDLLCDQAMHGTRIKTKARIAILKWWQAQIVILKWGRVAHE